MKKRIIIIVGIILVLAVVSIAESFNHDRSDAPEEADVILMLGGGDGGRMMKAAELYHEGYSDYVVISPALDEYYTQSVQFALDLGIPESAIIEELVATSTYTNATETMDIMEARDFQSALVVTSDYHLKRSKLIYDRVNSNDYDNKFDFTYVAALSMDGDPWYELSYSANIWFREYVKLWGYRLGLYHFIDIPDDGDAQV
ncbi:YdcF family protein [Salinicoccus halitifaciens]|uniref:Uncharacterized SAM-binding protein YcdF (DUF218 family) n=1 Tax=Salinicoccus halitifaciens TaxID=1073415 RepID=A0ABV2E9K6_9STAP|nr:YdcF family protein [Salinicoccus halitifaciens]MCD2136480.1 YdcF family protein [Salinicoccus halitifaciens]